jgi:uncharacterized protein YukE
MTSGFRVDDGLLARRAGAFDGLAERADRIAGDLDERLSRHGECWGGDAVGLAFAEGHVEPAGAALRDIGTLAAGLRDVGGRLGDTATTYRESDLAAGDTVRAAGGGLG